MDVDSFGQLLDDYEGMFPKQYKEKRRHQLAKYLAYLLEVRVALSARHECPKLMWKMYKKYYKMDPIVPKLKEFVKERHEEIVRAVIDQSLPPNVRKSHQNKSETKKVTINSRYGLIQSTVDPRFQPTVSGRGRLSIRQVTSCLRRNMDTREFYGDSVTGYTPFAVRDEHGDVRVTNFDSFAASSGEWKTRPDGKQELTFTNGQECLTSLGWRPMWRLIRHKCPGKKLYRVITRGAGVVDVTEDHSLLLKDDDAQRTPLELLWGEDKLLTHDPFERFDPMENSDMSYAYGWNVGALAVALDKDAFTPVTCLKQECRLVPPLLLRGGPKALAGYVKGGGGRRIVTPYQATALSFTVALSMLGRAYSVTTDDAGNYVVMSGRGSGVVDEDRVVVESVSYLGMCAEDQYVYDIETQTGDFAAGVGGLLVKNTDSCFVYKRNLTPFDMLAMTAEDMHHTLMFEPLVGMKLEDFRKEVYDKHYPVDETSPREIRQAAGSVKHTLCVMMEKGLSSRYLEVEAEKTLNPTILPTAKKYIAHNCVTGKPITKGLSLNNKSAAELTREVLMFLYNAAVDSFNLYEFASKLYHKLGSDFLAQINPTAPPEVIRKISKPTSVDLKKVKGGTKQSNLLKRMGATGVDFMFDKVHLKVVPVLPVEGEDKGWSINDVLEMTVDPATLHVVKAKYDILQETMSIITSTFKRGVCEAFEALITGVYDPDDFRALENMEYDKPFKARPLSKILGLTGCGRKPAGSVKKKTSTTRSGASGATKPRKRKVPCGVVFDDDDDESTRELTTSRQTDMAGFVTKVAEDPSSKRLRPAPSPPSKRLRPADPPEGPPKAQGTMDEVLNHRRTGTTEPAV